jgi:hypothetical protein
MLAVALWMSYGGGVSVPELLVVILGHGLIAALTILVGLALAAATDHPSTAAIVALAITIGTWMLDFAAAVYGGLWERAAQYTPAAFISMFQHGLVQVNAVAAATSMAAGAVAITVVWIRPGTRTSRRVLGTARLLAVLALTVLAASQLQGSWDASETRVNSFAEPVQEAIERVVQPIRVEVHLAPQDARRAAFDRGPLAKLRRIRPDTAVSYVAGTSTGLYEQAAPGYGEIRYSLDGRTVTTRAVTDDALAESVLSLAGITETDEQESIYRGRPLAATPVMAPALFFAVWPALVAGLWLFTARRHS